jgi:hypothetical protein
MARLPKVGEEAWGDVLNEFLLVSHNTDGTPREKAIGKLATTATIGLRDLIVTNPAGQSLSNLVLTNDNTNLMWKEIKDILKMSSVVGINVLDFGAKGDGVTDDTDAIQAAIDSATRGGIVKFPRGIYKIRGIKLKKHGTALEGESRWSTQLVRISGADTSIPLIDMSGTASMTGHLRYCALSRISVHGGNQAGTLLRMYYADSCTIVDSHFLNNTNTSTDLVEVWDTRFARCIWENCGSVEHAATLLRNSMPYGEFGYSDDNTNQVYFNQCRWESFRNGALRLDGAANGSPRLLNGVFIASCKMETRYAAGPALQIKSGSTIVFVNQFYIAMMSFDAGYSNPVDAIEDWGSHVFMTDVYVQWGATLIANSLVHIWANGPHMFTKLSTFYPVTDPLKAVVIAEPESFGVVASASPTNRGLLTVGNVSTMMSQSPAEGVKIPINPSGVFLVSSNTTGKDLVKVSNSGTRPALFLPNGVDIAGFSDNYAAETWRIVGSSGSAKFAGGKFSIEYSKGYVGMGTSPYTGIAMLIKPAVEGDRGIAVVRPSSNATNRLMEFQDETYHIQGMAIDSNGRPLAVGTPPTVSPGDQATYANPRVQVRDIAGNVIAAVRVAPTAPGVIATITFSRPYSSVPLCITIADHSETESSLYVSSRSASAFTVSTRTALRAGSMVSFDYSVIA